MRLCVLPIFPSTSLEKMASRKRSFFLNFEQFSVQAYLSSSPPFLGFDVVSFSNVLSPDEGRLLRDRPSLPEPVSSSLHERVSVRFSDFPLAFCPISPLSLLSPTVCSRLLPAFPPKIRASLHSFHARRGGWCVRFCFLAVFVLSADPTVGAPLLFFLSRRLRFHLILFACICAADPVKKLFFLHFFYLTSLTIQHFRPFVLPPIIEEMKFPFFYLSLLFILCGQSFALLR